MQEVSITGGKSGAGGEEPSLKEGSSPGAFSHRPYHVWRQGSIQNINLGEKLVVRVLITFVSYQKTGTKTHLIVLKIKAQRNELVDEVIAEKVEDCRLAADVLDKDRQGLQHLQNSIASASITHSPSLQSAVLRCAIFSFHTKTQHLYLLNERAMRAIHRAGLPSDIDWKVGQTRHR